MAKTDVVVPVAEFVAPARALSEMALANAECLVELYVDSVRRYANIAFEGYKQALTVQDLEEAQKFLATQGEVVRQVADGLVNDAAAVVSLSQGCFGAVQKVVSDQVEEVTKQVA